jgi:alpha-beta hydrolase superfamily lysophospholipase
MNHISNSFTAEDGRVYKSHQWELRDGGYRRIAILALSGVRPIDQETRLLRFLIERGFRVAALDLAYGAPPSPRPSLRAFRRAIVSFAASAAAPDLPLFLIASSFSAGALLPAAASFPALSAAALIGPVVDFPPPSLKRSLFFMPSAELVVNPKVLCGDSELCEELLEKDCVYRFRKADLRTAAAEFAQLAAHPLAIPLAAFSGGADPLITDEGRRSLAASGAKLYAYPRVRHAPGSDRYADNFYADLGAFIDEVEARSPSAPSGTSRSPNR